MADDAREADPVIELQNVRVDYAGAPRPAVRAATLTIAGGAFVALVGPSGSGKTSLLKTINRLVEPAGGVQAPQVQLAACGAVLPEVLAAAQELTAEGIGVTVVDITSADRLYAEWQRTLRQGIRTARTPAAPGGLRAAFRPGVPLVTVHDAASHALAWLGSALGSVAVPLGVDEFGQSGAVSELYGLHDLLPGSIVNAALAALSLQN